MVAILAGSCGGATNKPVTGSESHFLATCDGECPNGLECLCGVCTKRCTETSECSRLASGARCVELDDVGATHCASVSPAQAVCDRPCAEDAECAKLGATFSCTANGVCREADSGVGGASFGGAGGVAGKSGGVAGAAGVAGKGGDVGGAAGVAGKGGDVGGAAGVAGKGGDVGGAAGVAGKGGVDPVRPPLCGLPLEPGDCNGALQRFGFDGSVCRPFIYGGCGGNDNNFATYEECVIGCTGLPPEAFECAEDYQCARAYASVCPCDPMDRNDFVAVNNVFYGDFEATKPPVVCAPCPLLPRAEMTSANFGARCNAGRCEIFDVRQEAYSECTPEIGCELRGGAQCCENCDATSGLTAIRTGAGDELWNDQGCGQLPILCSAACEQPPASEATAECIDDRCRVVTP